MADNIWDSILIPVDFSKYSAAALKLGLELAPKVARRLIVLHVGVDPTDMPGFKQSGKAEQKVTRKVEDTSQDRFEAFLDEHDVKKALKDTPVKLEKILVQGRPLQAILDCIKKEKPSLVIMGSRGHTRSPHVLIGSKAERVMQLSPAPVMVVKPPSKKAGKKDKDKEKGEKNK